MFNTCRICGYQGNVEKITVREMLYGTREEFDYFRCPDCNCLQICTVPENLGEYYRTDYYSYEQREGKSIPHSQINNTRVLDVGCGSGAFLCDLAMEGYVNLCGCDPFLKENIFYENGVKIYKKSIHEMDGEYDRIYLNDSFEHVTDPHEVMESIERLLAPGGAAKIKLPIFPNIAYDMFGVNWYQLDAPRHIFLHSTKSMQYLAKRHGLRIAECVWDSDNSQIVRSFLYANDIPFIEQTEAIARKYFSQQDISDITHNVKLANQNEYGDHAIFIMVKNRT